MIEFIFALRRDRFKNYLSVPPGLDLIYKGDEYMHMITLDRQYETEPVLGMSRLLNNMIDISPHLDQFSYNDKYEENERKYQLLVRIMFDKTCQKEDRSSSDSLHVDEEKDKDNSAEGK